MNNLSEFNAEIDTFFLRTRWVKNYCPCCGRKFYSPTQKQLCNDISCQQKFTLIKKARPKKQLTIEELWGTSFSWFMGKHLIKNNRSNIVNLIGDTMFVGAGLQIFDDVFHRQATPSNLPYFVPQPSIRLNYLNEAGKQDGISTSFLNLCTEQADVDFDVFIAHLEYWLEYIYYINLDANLISINLLSHEWSPNGFKGWSLVFYYGGLELGDGNFIFKTPGSEIKLAVVDFSFGLERLLWASSNNKSYFDGIGSELDIIQRNYVLIDLIRTATLMALSGVQPHSKAHGRLLRKLIQKSSNDIFSGDISRLVKTSYDYWSLFIAPKVSYWDCNKVISDEAVRYLNFDISRQLDLSVNFDKLYFYKSPKDFCLTYINPRLKKKQTIKNTSFVADQVSTNNPQQLHLENYNKNLIFHKNITRIEELVDFTSDITSELAISFYNNPKDRIVVDIGANIGLFCLMIANRYPDARIIALEPSDERLWLLKRNFEVNNVTNASVIKAALWSHKSTMRLYHSGMTSSLLRKSSKYELVNTMSLKQLVSVNKLSEISLLNLNCKGAETKIISTCPSSILSIIDKIYINHSLDLTKPNEYKSAVEKLRENGFVSSDQLWFDKVRFRVMYNRKF